jgi:hypothetical protein
MGSGATRLTLAMSSWRRADLLSLCALAPPPILQKNGLLSNCLEVPWAGAFIGNWMRKLSEIALIVLLIPACAREVAPPKTAPKLAPLPVQTAETSAPAPKPEPTVSAEPPSRLPDEPLVAELPTTCSAGTSCVPPHDFAVAACKGRYPAMAIAMFEKHTPWQRLYLKAESIEAVNAYGVRATPAPIVFGEEVIVLRDAGTTSAGAASTSSMDIDVLRWDGSCATVSKELFVPHQMREVRNAHIEWRSLDGYMRQALLKSKYVKMSYEAYRTHCKEERTLERREPEPECERIGQMMNDSITVAVRGGIALPVPDKLPLWAHPKADADGGAMAMAGESPLGL